MNKLLRFVPAPLMVLGGSAMAAVDTTAIDAAKTDALGYAGAVAACVIAIWGAKLAYRKFFGG